MSAVNGTRAFRLKARRERLGLSQSEVGGLINRSAFVVCSAEAYDLGLPRSYPSTVPGHVVAIRRALLTCELEPRCRREELRRDARRIAFQRSLWDALPDHPAKRALQAAMLDRCLDLMHEGEGGATDALAEFLPELDVEAMFAQWERECFPPTEAEA